MGVFSVMAERPWGGWGWSAATSAVVSVPVPAVISKGRSFPAPEFLLPSPRRRASGQFSIDRFGLASVDLFRAAFMPPSPPFDGVLGAGSNSCVREQLQLRVTTELGAE
ncbi:hypothetical protein VNO77_44250 [Canavalia gladiata]|uniref:Uncharacterized protein n=1 Tax=Canavalia gladiata TaxID=3824 RepID=A0AAN9PQ69_CANGL